MADQVRIAIAVKRGSRGQVQTDWLDKLVATVDGIEIVGQAPNRAQLRCPPKCVEQITSELGDAFIVEPILERTIPER